MSQEEGSSSRSSVIRSNTALNDDRSIGGSSRDASREYINTWQAESRSVDTIASRQGFGSVGNTGKPLTPRGMFVRHHTHSALPTAASFQNRDSQQTQSPQASTDDTHPRRRSLPRLYYSFNYNQQPIMAFHQFFTRKLSFTPHEIRILVCDSDVPHNALVKELLSKAGYPGMY